MELFSNQDSNHLPFEGFYNQANGMQNRAPLFLKNMEIATKGQYPQNEFIATRQEWLERTEIFEMGRSFHDGQLHLQVKNSFIQWYCNKYHRSLNKDFYLHFVGTGMNGVYFIYAGQPNMVYVGSAGGVSDDRTFCDRWKEHISHLKRGVHHCKRLQIAYNKTRVFMPIIMYCTNGNTVHRSENAAAILKKEQSYIKALWENCYNKRRF